MGNAGCLGQLETPVSETNRMASRARHVLVPIAERRQGDGTM
jgi:hypothetical protein